MMEEKTTKMGLLEWRVSRMSHMRHSKRWGSVKHGRVALMLTCLAFCGGCATAAQQAVTTAYDQAERHRKEAGRDLPALGPTASLEDYLRYAALNNAGLAAAFDRWRAALEEIPQARSLPNPRFTFSQFIKEVETRVGPQQRKIELAQMLPWFGTLKLKGNRAAAAAEVARWKYEAAKLKLFHRIKTLYYDYYYLEHAIAVTQRNRALLTELEAVALTQYRAGKAPHSSVIKVQIELERLADRTRSLEDMRQPLRAKLNAALNREAGAPIPAPARLPGVREPLGLATLEAALADRNAELHRIDHVVKQKELGVHLAETKRWPEIMLAVGLIETGKASAPDIEESGKDPVVASAGLSVPIWLGRNRSEIAQATADRAAAEKDRDQQEHTLTADLGWAWYQFTDAAKRIELYEKTLVPKARQSLEVTRQAFETGKADFLDLIDAERMLLELELSLVQHQAARLQHFADIEVLVGEELTLR